MPEAIRDQNALESSDYSPTQGDGVIRPFFDNNNKKKELETLILDFNHGLDNTDLTSLVADYLLENHSYKGETKGEIYLKNHVKEIADQVIEQVIEYVKIIKERNSIEQTL